MHFTKKAQPAWPFPQKRFYVNPVKAKPQPKGVYPDTFSQPVLPTTWQTSWADSLFWKKVA